MRQMFHKIKTDLLVPYSFCKNCSMRKIITTEYDISSLEKQQIKVEHNCENMYICMNAIDLYEEDKNEKTNL